MTLSLISNGAGAESCNGFPHLCDKLYNQVTFATSHNALSYKPNLNIDESLSFLPLSWREKAANILTVNVHDQDLDLKAQLQDGIRAMKLRVMLAKGKPYVCHGLGPRAKEQVKETVCKKLFFSFLENQCNKTVENMDPCFVDPTAAPLSEALAPISDFLRQNPREVVTLFIEDNLYHFDALKKSFDEGLVSKYLHIQSVNKRWPSLREMIQKDKRLVVFESIDKDEAGKTIRNYPFNRFSDFVWGSRFHFESVNELVSDEPHASDLMEEAYGDRNQPPYNKLWLLQHFITRDLAGRPSFASEVNESSILTARIGRYQKIIGSKPNFIWVDFYELPKGKPGLFHIVNQLNR
jgi:hypothetical protein